MANRKFYVVWEGREPGIYEDWDDCLAQVDGYPGAKFKAFSDQLAATLAFRGDPADQASMIEAIARHNADLARERAASLMEIPEINKAAIAVDGACGGNPGPMEYRGVSVATGEEIFHLGPLPDGTNNVAEYLALVHALAYLYQRNDRTTPVYSDSKIARGWIRNRAHRSKLERTPRNGRIFELLARADQWLQSHTIENPVLRWDTDAWGEIPADFNRK